MVRKKKDVIKPVVAKPLNDTQKINLVSSFVTTNIDKNITGDVTKYDTKDVTNNDVISITNEVTKEDTKSVTNNITEEETNIVTNNDTIKVTKNDTKIVTKRVLKKVMITKSITLGKKDIIAKFTSDKKVRPNYNLSEDTIEKIEKISEILGYKKAEFVDIYLNGTLEKVLKDLEKNK